MKSHKVISTVQMAIGLAVIFGWSANVYKIVSNGFELATWGGMEVARVIGVFIPPLGAILGFF